WHILYINKVIKQNNTNHLDDHPAQFPTDSPRLGEIPDLQSPALPYPEDQTVVGEDLYHVPHGLRR
ncbi:MAG: hypothetical protein R3B93_29415, partial [Bacteroidia bacterium]